MVLKTIKYILTGFLSVLIVLAALLFSYSYMNPCKIPIEYSLGDNDSRFHLSSQQLLANSNDAANRWNESLGKKVFLYNPNAKLKINLAYDQRQANLDSLNQQLKEIDSSANSIEELKSQTETRINQYNVDLEKYNSKVDYWNSRGGAPSNIYNQLNSEKSSLDKTKKLIDQSTVLLNSMIEQHNNNVGNFNAENEADDNKLFTQGLFYQGQNKIDIFTFNDAKELRLVLMHEIGHALSIDHDTVDTSIMYPILEKQNLDNPIPSDEDISMINKTCKLQNINYTNNFFNLMRKISGILPWMLL